MRPLTFDDLLPLEEFAVRRRELFESHSRYLDRYRRVRVGPRLTLLFENRQTLWFRLQEILRIARLSDPARVQQELDVYNQLLPNPKQLAAALIFTGTDASRQSEETWRDLRGADLKLRIGEEHCCARLVTCRPEDHAIGAAHWLEFHVSDEHRKLLANPRIPAWLEVAHAAYQVQSPPLSEDVRQSLLDDLFLSDRD